MLRRFPALKFLVVGGGIGWIPYLLDRLDRIYTRHHRWTGQDFGDQLPAQAFRDRIVTCFIDDPAGVRVRDPVGIDTICWEADYPHSDSPWPTSPEFLMKSLDGVPDDEIDKLTHGNAMRHFRFDPFSARPPEASTVGALRAAAAAADVDASVRSAGERARGSRHTKATELLKVRRWRSRASPVASPTGAGEMARRGHSRARPVGGSS